MKLCARCKQSLDDTVESCIRCGSTKFMFLADHAPTQQANQDSQSMVHQNRQPMPTQRKNRQPVIQPNRPQIQQRQQIQQEQMIQQEPVTDDTVDITVIDWMKLFILLAIPVINIIYCIKIVMSESRQFYVKTFAKAYILYYLICTIFSIVLALFI